MKKAAKTWLIIAVTLTALGLIIFAGVMLTYNWDFSRLSTVKYVTNTYKINDTFDKISIDVDTTEIEFALTDDKECSIVCYEAEKVRHSAAVQNGTLGISTIDTRKWYEYICISLGTPKLTVYLPQNEYTSLLIETDTGDIVIPKDVAFKDITIEGDTADVDCFASGLNTINIKTSTGSINVESIETSRLNVTATTGEINVNNVTADNIDMASDTGKITLDNVVATEKMSIESDTGNVKFKDSDAEEIYVKTSTGDVSGTLLSPKVFITETSTGRVKVPQTASGGKCRICTSTGDIKIEIK